jgi:hypothetical protein
VDGRLYPIDPATLKAPTFSTTKEFLEFLDEGESGMLGYTKYFKSRANALSMERTISALQSTVSGYEI